jgi:hypothetical protein
MSLSCSSQICLGYVCGVASMRRMRIAQVKARKGWAIYIHYYLEVRTRVEKQTDQASPILFLRNAILNTNITASRLILKELTRVDIFLPVPHREQDGRQLCRRMHGESNARKEIQL